MSEKIRLKDYFDMFTIFFRIGAFTFGGGYAMIPLIEKEIVDNKGWVKKEEIIDIFAVAQSIPGAIAINSSSLIGYKIAKSKGSIVSTFGIILPSFIIISLIAGFFTRILDVPQVEAAFLGITAAVVALILTASINISKSSIKDIFTLTITVVTVLAVVFFDISPIIMILLGVALGFVAYKIFPEKV